MSDYHHDSSDPLDDKTAEFMRRFLAGADADLAKSKKKPTRFIELLRKALARYDARPKTLH
jgi:hypothetical protein